MTSIRVIALIFGMALSAGGCGGSQSATPTGPDSSHKPSDADGVAPDDLMDGDLCDPEGKDGDGDKDGRNKGRDPCGPSDGW